MLTENGFILDGTTKITYDTAEGIENYYSIDNGTTWQEYTGEFQYALAGTVYAKSIKKSNGKESTASKAVSIPSDALPLSNMDTLTKTNNKATNTYYMYIDESVVGRKFSYDYGTYTKNDAAHNYVKVLFYDINGTLIYSYGPYSGDVSYGNSTIKTLTIREGTVKIGFELYGSAAANYAKLYNVYLNN